MICEGLTECNWLSHQPNVIKFTETQIVELLERISGLTGWAYMGDNECFRDEIRDCDTFREIAKISACSADNGIGDDIAQLPSIIRYLLSENKRLRKLLEE